jgi:hypothetical protein
VIFCWETIVQCNTGLKFMCVPVRTGLAILLIYEGHLAVDAGELATWCQLLAARPITVVAQSHACTP